MGAKGWKRKKQAYVPSMKNKHCFLIIFFKIIINSVREIQFKKSNESHRVEKVQNYYSPEKFLCLIEHTSRIG